MRVGDKYSEAVAVTLRRSPIVIGFVAAAGSGTLALVALTPLPVAARILAATWIACSALDALRRALVIRKLVVDRSGDVAVDEAAGHLRDGSFVAPWLTIVRWRPAGAILDRSLLVLPDMLDLEDFRRVRVLLKFGKPGSDPGPARVRPRF